MKNFYFKTLILLALITLVNQAYSQDNLSGNKKLPLITIVDFDENGTELDKGEAKLFLLNELKRIGKFDVLDRYEVTYRAKKDSLVLDGCFSRSCMQEVGKKLGLDYMLSGSIEKLGTHYVVTLRLLNVSTAVFEKSTVREFLVIPGQELVMIRVVVNEMFEFQNDESMVRKLTVDQDYGSKVNNPNAAIIQADGPRMGVVSYFGLNRQILQADRSEGGFDTYPYMFQFGYQFEEQYLNSGNVQGLVEFIPTISGIDQGKLIPSITILNGFRNNKNGWELAMGPTISFVKAPKGFYYDIDSNGTTDWVLADRRYDYNISHEDIVLERRIDSRGGFTDIVVSTGMLFAVGKTFKSGDLNMPVNMFFVPGRNGSRLGISFGWNLSKP